MTAAVVVDAISKRYTLGTGGGYRRLTEVLTDKMSRSGRRTSTRDELWALKDVSFEVAQGEVIGIIGRNGAGKSTLLKILSRITEPTSGRAVLKGRVGSLLEVGTGFHPELTGRENIFLNGAVLGMRKSEITRRFDEIVDFAEIDRFLDTPVKRYSSGMYVRLAFAVAAHLEPEILVVDEVLAVGDTAFQKRCLGRMSDVARSGRTVLFVSHNMTAIRSLCSHALMLQAGQVVTSGDVDDVVGQYLDEVAGSESTDLRHAHRTGDGRVRVVAARVRSPRGGEYVNSGEPLIFELDYEADEDIRRAQVQIGIYDLSNAGLYLLDSDVTQGLPDELPRRGTLTCSTGDVQINPGVCYANIAVQVAGELSDYVPNAIQFAVEAADPWGNGRVPPREWVLFDLPQRWTLSS
jgi:lipopolysaccharide transport system ATP-binding protein